MVTYTWRRATLALILIIIFRNFYLDIYNGTDNIILPTSRKIHWELPVDSVFVTSVTLTLVTSVPVSVPSIVMVTLVPSVVPPPVIPVLVMSFLLNTPFWVVISLVLPPVIRVLVMWLLLDTPFWVVTQGCVEHRSC